MSVLELNSKAKIHVEAKQKALEVLNKGTLLIQPDTQYILNNGDIIGPLSPQEGAAFQGEWYCPGHGYYNADGCFTSYSMDDPRSIMCEWFPTWKEYLAWTQGKKIEVAVAGMDKWFDVHVNPKHVAIVTGPGGTRKWWKEQVEELQYQVRIK